MNKSALAILSLMFALASFTLTLRQYTLAEGATVTFTMTSENVVGSIGGLQTEINFDENRLESSSISGFVEVSLLDTGIKPRNKHLQQKGYFDEKNHGQISFRSKEIQKSTEGYSMKGDLTMKGVTKELDWSFTFDGNTFIGQTTLYTNDFGVYTKKDREKTRVDITVTAPVQ